MAVLRHRYLYQTLNLEICRGAAKGRQLCTATPSTMTSRRPGQSGLAPLMASSTLSIPDQAANDSDAQTGDSTGCVVLRNVNDILSVYQIHGGAQLLRVDGDNWPDSVA